jgi:hypothetical protein
MSEMDEPDNVGENFVHHNRRGSRICLLCPEDYHSRVGEPQDHQFTLVHELVHLWTEEVMHEVKSEAEALAGRLYTQEEQLVNRITRALIFLNERTAATS